MTNKSKAKGTGGEREVVERLRRVYGDDIVVRTPAASVVDIICAGERAHRGTGLEVLYTRPDRGRWLVTLSASDFEDLLANFAKLDLPRMDVEVKRYARFALHSVFEKKFGPRRQG